MAQSVDERIVSMEFDNKQFESGVTTTLNTLFKLKEGLNLKEATKNLLTLGDVGRAFSLSGMANGIREVSTAFSSLGIIGITTLSNITNSALAAGKNLTSAFTIDPVRKGWAEYELKMNSVQTIMAGTGEKIETVSRYLEELNEYSDQTIYSFSDMTTNIGKFTNAGVKLDKAVAAIKGISNVAAVSGANANEASRAMYNFSQALSAGYVKLLDWKSIEMANMATMEFKTQLMDTALQMGTLTKTTDGYYKTLSGTTFKATQMFNESLTDQWMTTDVLVSTLNDYADETTEIGKKAFAAAKDVKTFTMLLGALKEQAGSGWAQTWEIVIGNLEEAKKLYTGINDVISGALMASNDARNETLKAWKDLGGRTELLSALSDVFRVLGEIMKPISDAWKEIFPRATGEQLLELTKKFKAFTSSLKIGDATSENIKTTFKGLFAVIKTGIDIFKFLARIVTSLIGYFFPLSDGIIGIIAYFAKFGLEVRKAVDDADVFNRVFNTMVTIFKPLGDSLRNVAQYLSDMVRAIMAGRTIAPIVDLLIDFGDAIGVAIDSLYKADTGAMRKFSSEAEKAFAPLLLVMDQMKANFKMFVDSFSLIMPWFSNFVKSIKDGWNTIVDIITSGYAAFDFSIFYKVFAGGLATAAAVWVYKFIKFIKEFMEAWKGLADSVSKVLDSTSKAIQAFTKNIKANLLMKIAKSLAILAVSLWVLSTIKVENLAAALGALTVMMLELFLLFKALDKLSKSGGFANMAKISTTLIIFGAAILLLSFALKQMQSLEWDQLLRGLVGLGYMALMLVGVSYAMEGSTTNLTKASIGLILFASAMKSMMKIVIELSTMDFGLMMKGMAMLAILFAELGLFIRFGQVDKIGASSGGGILFIALAINLLAKAVQTLGAMDSNTLIVGMYTLALMLTMIAGFTKVAGDPKNMLATALGMTVIASSLFIFIKAMQVLAEMDNIKLLKGLVSMGYALFIISGSILMLQDANALMGAAAIMIMAVALRTLLPVIETLGNMKITEIGMAMLALVGVFGLFAGLGLIGTAIAPGIVAFALALGILGGAMMLLGLGVSIFAGGMTILSSVGMVGMESLKIMAMGIFELIPIILKGLVEGIGAVVQTLNANMPYVASMLITLISEVMRLVFTIVPEFIVHVLQLLDTVLAALVLYAPKIGASVMFLLVAFITAITSNVANVAVAAVQLIIGFISGIVSKMPDIVQSAFDMVIALINGIADAIRNNKDKVFDAIGNLITAIGEALLDLGSRLVEFGKNIIEGMINGIKQKASDLVSAAMDAVTSTVEKVAKFLGIASPSKLMAQMGTYWGEGFIVGIKSTTKGIGKAATAVGNKAVNAMSYAMSMIQNQLDTDLDYSPTIRPVIDLTEVNKGVNTINKSLGQNGGILLSSAYNKTNGIALAMADKGINTSGKDSDTTDSKTIVFTQNNYSPKELSAIEIYRQTRNQLNLAKGV